MGILINDIVQNYQFSLKKCQVHSEGSGEEGVLRTQAGDRGLALCTW